MLLTYVSIMILDMETDKIIKTLTKLNIKYLKGEVIDKLSWEKACEMNNSYFCNYV